MARSGVYFTRSCPEIQFREISQQPEAGTDPTNGLLHLALSGGLVFKFLIAPLKNILYELALSLRYFQLFGLRIDAAASNLTVNLVPVIFRRRTRPATW